MVLQFVDVMGPSCVGFQAVHVANLNCIQHKCSSNSPAFAAIAAGSFGHGASWCLCLKIDYTFAALEREL